MAALNEVKRLFSLLFLLFTGGSKPRRSGQCELCGQLKPETNWRLMEPAFRLRAESALRGCAAGSRSASFVFQTRHVESGRAAHPVKIPRRSN